MSWGTLAKAYGYKGPFLLVWCMMHWAKIRDDLELWRAVAEDMTKVFKALRAARQSVGRAGRNTPAAGGNQGAGTKRHGEEDTVERPVKQRKGDAEAETGKLETTSLF